ncbi:hypothetical protein D1814_10095 [Alteromonas sp. BL110]|uniref:hypothetical protein n=1 Tax=Alteromonas sp. BL110 TaxID=1714845 RepID=UPI000E4C481E|nr:hypothetical protein [Alteromonas sp. BL110]AXT39009.1 hypothetical protein D1814_10095 [Alteromonas sp. BL110]RKM84342.1 hypothetical protein D7031_01395 [Alteromonas sp. BL110]
MKKIVYPKGLKLKQNLSEYELETYEETIEQSLLDYGYDSVLIFPDIYLFSKLNPLSLEATRDKWMQVARTVTFYLGDSEDMKVIFLGSSSAELFKNGNDWEVVTSSSEPLSAQDANIIALTLLLSDNREYSRLVSQLKLVCVSSYNVGFPEHFKSQVNINKLINILEDGHKVDTYKSQQESCMNELEGLKSQINELTKSLEEKEIQSKLSESELTRVNNTSRERTLEVEELKVENQSLSSTQVELEKHLEESKLLIDNYESRVKQLESVINEQKTEIEKLRDAKEEYSGRNSELEKRLSNSSDLAERYKSDVEKLNSDLRAHKISYQNKKENEKKLVDKNQELAKQLAEASTNAELYQSDIEKLNALTNSYAASIDELRLKMKSHESVELEKNAIRHDYGFALKNYENTLFELQNIREAFNDTKRNLAKSVDMQSTQRTEINSLKQQADIINRALKTEQEKRNAVAKALKLEQERNLNLEKAVEKQTRDHKALIAMIDEKESEHKMFIDRHAKNVTKLEEENKSLFEQLSSNQLTFATSLENKNKHIEQLQAEKKETLSKLIVVSRDSTKLNNRFSKLKLNYNILSYEKFLLEGELKASSSFFGRAKGALSNIKNFRRKSAIEARQQDTSQIATSEYFDIEWYLRTYPDVQESGINPAEHYLLFGATEARMPSPHFDTVWYLERYPDVRESGINPLLHFIKYGQTEGRVASPKLLERVDFEKK